MHGLLKRIFGDRNTRLVRDLQRVVARINARDVEVRALPDGAFPERFAALRKRRADGEPLDALLEEAFALTRDAARRAIGLRPFDVQLIGGMVLHQGKIAEMVTGEGKTLVATLPVALNALEGKGVHLVTVNDYLARRDCEWMGPVYAFLGLTSGAIQADMDPPSRRAAYDCDVTYGTNSEFGFDYLRDNMAVRREDQVQQRGRHYAIVDEVDSILIDEARTPLIISGPAEESTDKYFQADQVARRLKPGEHFEIREKEKQVSLLEDGIPAIEKELGIESMYAELHMDWPHHIEQALRAQHLYKRDTEYVVQEGEVIIVDEFTGRMQPGRRWSEGLHQAIEAKEKLKVKRENQTLATVTIQNYFRMYAKLAGMTGTAQTEAEEFFKIYKLDVVVVPTNRPLRRINHIDKVFRTAREKAVAIEEEVARLHEAGRPILVGTTSIEKSEQLSERLTRRGIPHEVLNAKQHAREAQIVEKAGEKGRVMIATNMAGRGTDIRLGAGVVNPQCVHATTGETWCCIACNRPERADGCKGCWKYERRPQYLKCEDQNRAPCPCGSGKAYERCHYPEHGEWADIPCGLHISGSERHEARRIDNQLRGRSGRQGDPGSSRFFLSLDDDLMRIFAGPWVQKVFERIGMQEGDQIESGMVTRGISRAQRRVEEHNFEIRRHLVERDGVMDEQRKEVYSQRQAILEQAELKPMLLEWIAESIDQVLDRLEDAAHDAAAQDLAAWMKRTYDAAVEPPEIPRGRDERHTFLSERARASYEKKEAAIGAEAMRQRERYLLLLKLDTKWKEHLYAMDHLQKGINLRSYGQIDPKIAFKKEGWELYGEMVGGLRSEVTSLLLHVEGAAEQDMSRLGRVWRVQEAVHAAFEKHAKEQKEAAASASAGEAAPKPFLANLGTGRNAPCPCGSGKKYKKCCGAGT